MVQLTGKINYKLKIADVKVCNFFEFILKAKIHEFIMFVTYYFMIYEQKIVIKIKQKHTI